MDRDDRKRLSDLESYCVERLDVDDNVLANGYTKRMMNRGKIEILKSLRGGERVQRYIHFVQQSGRNGFNNFLQAMRDTGNTHVAEYAQRTNPDEEELEIDFDEVYANPGPTSAASAGAIEPPRFGRMDSVDTRSVGQAYADGVADLQCVAEGDRAELRAVVNGNERYYNIGLEQRMKRGRAICIHMTKVHGFSDRNGNQKDVENLRKLFESSNMKFEFKDYPELTVQQIRETLRREASRPELSHIHVLLVFVMSHGEDGAFLDTKGQSFKIADLLKHFNDENCVLLRRKPKVFCIEACQKGQPPDSITSSYKDMILSIAAKPGESAERYPSQGSLYILKLCDVIAKHSKHASVLDLLTETGRRVQTAYMSPQTPYLIWSSTKELFLCPGMS